MQHQWSGSQMQKMKLHVLFKVSVESRMRITDSEDICSFSANMFDFS